MDESKKRKKEKKANVIRLIQVTELFYLKQFLPYKSVGLAGEFTSRRHLALFSVSSAF